MSTRPPVSALPPAAELQRIAELIERRRPAEAAEVAAAVRARWPDAAEPARLLGIALLQLGRGEDAIAAFDTAAALMPQAVEPLVGLAAAQLAAGRPQAATATLEQALQLAPGHPAVLNNLGNARLALGDAQGACAAFADAADRHPGAALNLIATLTANGRADEAVAHARALLARDPRLADAHYLLGDALMAQRRQREAVEAYTAAERLAPGDARYPFQRGMALDEDRRIADAAAAYARALSLDAALAPALSQLVYAKRRLCDWRGLDALAARLHAAVARDEAGVTPFSFLSEESTPSEQLRCARRFARQIDAEQAPLRRRLAFAHRDLETARLRVGFVSNGFGEHPTALLIVAVLEALRGGALQTHLFATTADDGGPLRRRLAAAADALHEVVAPAPAELAQRIHAAGIEVLFDLRGWGAGSVGAALSLRPAPLQVNWLAYPGTSGAPWIDYLLADRAVLPPTQRSGYSEAIAWLPRCFQPSDTSRVIGEAPSRRDCGLPEAGTVFVSFNNSYKLNPATFARFMAVLRDVPAGVLWLLSGPDGADARLREAAQAAGVDPARMVFMPKLPHAEYLARYRRADLFLDTLPYNAHTTASDALWAGCPLLTCAGETFASRVAASLNQHLGMPELVAADTAGFVDTAIRLGNDPAALSALREELARRRETASLFDMPGFARDFEAMAMTMAERRHRGLAPADLG